MQCTQPQKSGTCTNLHNIPSLRPPSYYCPPRKRRCCKSHRINPRISGDPPQTIVPPHVRTPIEWRHMPDLLKQIRGIVGRKVRPITEPSSVTSISTVPPVLDNHQQYPVPFPPTELFGGERKIHCPPAGMKWRRRGWNALRLRLSRRQGRGISI